MVTEKKGIYKTNQSLVFKVKSIINELHLPETDIIDARRQAFRPMNREGLQFGLDSEDSLSRASVSSSGSSGN